MKNKTPIKIEKGFPQPETRKNENSHLGQLRVAIRNMKAGESFTCPDYRSAYRAAIEVNATVTTRKINGAGYRVWRVK